MARTAKSVTAHSQRFSPISPMRSPFFTPHSRKAAASARTRWYIWSDEMGCQCANSSCHKTARGLPAAATRKKRSLMVEIGTMVVIGFKIERRGPCTPATFESVSAQSGNRFSSPKGNSLSRAIPRRLTPCMTRFRHSRSTVYTSIWTTGLPDHLQISDFRIGPCLT